MSDRDSSATRTIIASSASARLTSWTTPTPDPQPTPVVVGPTQLTAGTDKPIIPIEVDPIPEEPP